MSEPNPVDVNELAATKNPLERQLRQWFAGVGSEWGVTELPNANEQAAISTLIAEANEVAGIIASEAYQQILEQKRDLAGPVRFGIIGCVDGRRKRNFPLGFIVSSTEEPAGEIVARVRNGHTMPESTILATALDRAVSPDEDLLQLAEAHTSLTTDHKCGAIGLKKAAGEVPEDETFEDAGLTIADKTLTVVTEHYNRARVADGLEPLTTAGVTILYDTDTMGYILGYDRRDEPGGTLSTTDLTKRYREEIASRLGDSVGQFSSMREAFTEVESVLPMAEKTLAIEKYLLLENTEYINELNTYIDRYYSELTDRQKQGLRYLLTTTVSFQYLTGLCDAADHGHPDHPFAGHGEEWLSISPDGKTFGARHPGKQVFGTSPSNIAAAVTALHVEIGLREKGLDDSKLFHPVFVTAAVEKDHLAKESLSGTLMPDDNETVQRAQARLINFMRGLYDDPGLRERIQSGNVLLIPGLIDQQTRELLRIPYVTNEI